MRRAWAWCARPSPTCLSFAGYQNGAKVWDDPEPKGHYAEFRPEMKALHRNHDPDVIAQMRERFSGRIAAPAFKPGDAMMLSNWTLHQTHATPAMVKTRENMELRFWSAASLKRSCPSTAFENSVVKDRLRRFGCIGLLLLIGCTFCLDVFHGLSLGQDRTGFHPIYRFRQSLAVAISRLHDPPAQADI